MLVFFWPLIVSTVLGVLAVISFGRQSDEHSTPIAGCGTAESAWQPDIIVFPSHEEKISNVLMVGSEEVTWLEWLHNEDTQKLCSHEHEPAVWEAYGCDGSMMASGASVVEPASRATIDASNGSTCKDEAIDDASLEAKEKGKLYAGGSSETHVSALVLENERALSTGLDRFRGTAPVLEVVNEEETHVSALVLKKERAPSTSLDWLTASVLEAVNKEETKMNATNLTDADEKYLDLTGEGHMCRFGRTLQNSIVLAGNEESNTHAPACAEGDEGQMSVEGLCLTEGGGNELKAMQGSLDSTIHTKNEVIGYASAGGNKVVSIVEATSECNNIARSLESTIDIESTQNKCVLEGETGLLVAVSTLEESTEAISHTSEPKIVHTHEQDALDLAFSNKIISPSLEMKGVEVHGMRHVDEQDEAERGTNQFETHAPQWDVSDGEEDRSSLCFSFFHNNSLTSSEA